MHIGMKSNTPVIFCLIGAALLLACESRAQYDLIGVSWAGTPVLRINPATGQSVTVGDAGFTRLNSLAQNGAGILYTAGGAGDTNLITINPDTGAGTKVGAFAFAPGVVPSVRGLAFSSDGSLYAINNGGPVGTGTVPDDLYTIDLNTGATTLIGNTGFNSLQALDFSPQGKLYGWDITKGLLLINQFTGAATDVNAQVGGINGIQSIVFGPDGTLYGAGTGLYTIDVDTGAYTHVGASQYDDVRGLEVVPEPSAWALIISALGLGLILRLRHSDS